MGVDVGAADSLTYLFNDGLRKCLAHGDVGFGCCLAAARLPVGGGGVLMGRDWAEERVGLGRMERMGSGRGVGASSAMQALLWVSLIPNRGWEWICRWFGSGSGEASDFSGQWSAVGGRWSRLLGGGRSVAGCTE